MSKETRELKEVEQLRIQHSITQCTLDTLDSVAQSQEKTNMTYILDFSKTLINTFKDEIIESYIIKEQETFHNNLKFYEKYIPFLKNQEKEELNNHRINFNANALNLGFSILPILLDENLIKFLSNKYYHLPKLFESMTKNLIFINKDIWGNEKDGLPPRVMYQLKGLMDRYKISNANYKLNKWIDKSYQQNTFEITKLPTNINSDINKTAKYLAYLFNLCDTDILLDSHSEAYKNAKILSTDYLGFTDDEFNLIIASSLNENTLLSSVIEITQFSIDEILNDLINNISHAEYRINTLIDHDPYKVKRETYKSKILKGGSLIGLGGLTFFTGGVGDFLLATSANLLLNVFEDSNNPRLAKEVKNRFWELYDKRDQQKRPKLRSSKTKVTKQRK